MLAFRKNKFAFCGLHGLQKNRYFLPRSQRMGILSIFLVVSKVEIHLSPGKPIFSHFHCSVILRQNDLRIFRNKILGNKTGTSDFCFHRIRIIQVRRNLGMLSKLLLKASSLFCKQIQSMYNYYAGT